MAKSPHVQFIKMEKLTFVVREEPFLKYKWKWRLQMFQGVLLGEKDEARQECMLTVCGIH